MAGRQPIAETGVLILSWPALGSPGRTVASIAVMRTGGRVVVAAVLPEVADEAGAAEEGAAVDGAAAVWAGAAAGVAAVDPDAAV
jgi:hypothetical protein